MTEKNALEQGKQTAEAWLLEGELSARTIANQGKANLNALFVQCRRMTPSQQETESAQWLLDQLWLLRREGEQAAEQVRFGGQLPAVRYHGRCARLQLVGESLAESGRLTEKSLLSWLEGVQQTAPLREKELSLLLPCVILGIVRRVRRIGERLDQPEAVQQLQESFDSLRLVSRTDFSERLEALSLIHQAFQQDEIYLQMDAGGRSRYRQRLAELAHKQHQLEPLLAQQLMEQAKAKEQHIGFLLYPQKQPASGWYPSLILGVTGFLSLWVGFYTGRWWAGWLGAVPISQLVKEIVDFVALRAVPPRPLFRLELKKGVPPEGKTLCVISALLSQEDTAQELCDKLERYYLANSFAGKQVKYGLLADLPDSQAPATQQEKERILQAKTLVNQLNQRYSDSFYLFTREPEYAPADQCYRGKERKRGALMALLNLLRGLPNELNLSAGNPSGLSGVAFLITLDSDTQPTVDAVRRLAGAMLHPLNRPILDEQKKIVVAGHGLIQPRIITSLADANATPFAALFGGQRGKDPYTGGAANLYYDLFQRGSYCGKGILDVEAAAKCLTGRFPDNRILSHDLLEGIFLRCGFCGDTPLIDGFPHTIEGYFRRQHRWVRGDWQAARWMLPQAPNQVGRNIPNPMTAVDRWKLLDNLRRSILPIVLALCFLTGGLRPRVNALLGWLAALTLGSELLFCTLGGLLRGFRGSGQRTYSQQNQGFWGIFRRELITLLLLPCEGWGNLSALCTALWRITVTHKGLLEWTVSAQAKGGKPFWVPGILAGTTLIFLAPTVGGKLLGVLWLSAPLLLGDLSQEKPKQERFTAGERAFLLHQGESIWQYFSQHLRPEDNYLPPDNVQELPAVGAARRTSPTNMGLSLLACLAALDLGLTSQAQAVELIRRQLNTLKKLEKWRGHLYNWYDTQQASPLYPRYVSTVDSGNLCGALIALKQGLLELGEQELAEQAQQLAEEMDFSLLYDHKRDLFYIGYDPEQGKFTDSWYDLLASEARQTSFLAVARGDVPPKHWERLSRAMTSQHHYFGLASWSGTMFEYFMPHLLLPAEKNTLLWESLAFCAAVQKQWGDKLNLPWGVSESAYHRVDRNQNYQYKAHGVPPLGLQRKLEQEQVTAPYATFLALEFLPHSGVKNLQRLIDLGAEGKFGLYEAVDFTPERTGSHPAVLRSWMVHHLGMSLLALDNALNGGIMRRRFMAEPAMEAHRELLQETVPMGLVPPKKLKITVKRDKMKPKKGYQRSGWGYDPRQPACHLLAFGELHHPVTAAGGGRLYSEKLVLLEETEARFHTATEQYQFLPIQQGGRELQWKFSPAGAELTLQEAHVTFSQRLTMDERGELRELTINAQQKGTLEVCIIPILDEEAAYEAHRAFSRLSLRVRELAGGAAISRRPREGKDYPSLVLLWEGKGRLTITENSILKLEIPVQVGETTLSFALSMGTEEQAYHAAQGLLLGAKTDSVDRFSTCASRYQLTELEQLQLDTLTSALCYPNSATGTPQGQPALWQYGISGDLPIWAVQLAQDETQGQRVLRQWATLQGCGLSCDLVLLLPEGERGTACAKELKKECERLQLTDFLGGRGGVHFVTAVSQAMETVTGMAAFVGLPEEPNGHFVLQPEPPTPTVPAANQPSWTWEGNDFVIHTGGGLLPRRWSQILTNGEFGWTADDCGTGHLWSGNAHENKLTPWQNDPYAHSGPERLFIQEKDQKIALFSAKDGIDTLIRYGAGTASWEKRWNHRSVSVTAFVPQGKKARFFLIETRGFDREAALQWKVTLQMAPHWKQAQYVQLSQKNGCIYAQNPANTEYQETLWFSADQPLDMEPQARSCAFTARLPVGERMVLYAGTEEPEACSWERACALLEETKQFWQEQAGCFQLRSPEEDFNHYLSFWGRYQTIACRLMARTALYQCGGAYGFRDQLQDVCGLLPNGKELAREQILRCCRHQYEEGDVQHWWHPLPQGERGVRTRISDDFLWLPYALCRWVQVTGDRTLLEEKTPWLQSPPLEKQEHQRYEQAKSSPQQDTVFDHCVRAIECSLGRGVGEHGLCLIGTGDWNDGMDKLGANGQGESVWLTWFLSLVLEEFSALCGEQRQERYQQVSKRLAERANQAWDGGWYRRAYDDQGTPVGSRTSPECQLDSIAQSFSVFAPNPDPERGKQAVQAAIDRLYCRKTGTVALLTPPFQAWREVGYISAYPGGIRENGGQYTHAAVWLAMAAFCTGEKEQGFQLLKTLLPEEKDNAVYQGEPYVLAGDVSTAPDRKGRAGWTWYTGAAAWFCRGATEELLGLRIREGNLFLRPQLPSHWHGYEATWKLDGLTLEIHVATGKNEALTVNGKPVSQGIPLSQYQGTVTIDCVIPQ
jgi:cyclic beta-1,2-glucan synthetase